LTRRLTCCYIYYRIAAPHAAAARAAILDALHILAERTGIVGRLFEGEDEPLLWMEVYEDIVDRERFETMLDGLLRGLRFTAFLAPGSERRIERFVAQAP